MDTNIKRRTDKLNVATIILLITTLITVLWWISKVDSQVLANSKWIAENKTMPVMIARIEEKLEGFSKQFDKFTKRVDKFMESE